MAVSVHGGIPETVNRSGEQLIGNTQLSFIIQMNNARTLGPTPQGRAPEVPAFSCVRTQGGAALAWPKRPGYGRETDVTQTMPDDFRISMMLADNAQAVAGKLYVLGAGWNWTIPGMPGSVAGIVTVPWNETNRKHVLTFNLVDDAGSAVRVPTPQGTQEPLTIRTEFEVGRPPGVRPGSSFSHPIAINYLALPLQPGRSYEWRWSINDKTRDDWRLAFEVRQAPLQPQAPPAS